MRNKSFVAVAMSGGVDSSVAAALLLEQGHDVVGFMLRLWSEPGKETSNRCCTPDSILLARQAASRLEIPFYVINAQQVFHNIIVNEFISGYTQGITPNPCLSCNKHIRFGFLLEHARVLGAKFLATGHYARIRRNGGEKFKLLRGIDENKDQSYVLHVLNQEVLQQALFPVGEYTKDQIRELALRYDLPTATRQDSQDLCFLAGDDYRNFLKRNAIDKISPGEIVTQGGKILGHHSGLAFYTIGQRRGLGISSSEPYYVIRKELSSNTLVVGTKDELGAKELIADNINWIDNDHPVNTFTAAVKIRYKSKDFSATIVPLSDTRTQIKFTEPVRDITPGQAAVIYNEDVCLGGGLITSAS